MIFQAAIVAAVSLALGAPAPDTLRLAELSEELVIPDAGDAEGGWGRIADAAVDATGHVYVASAIDQTIRVFSPEGALVGMSGGQGDGPGEYRSIVDLDAQSDRLVVRDVALNRITVLDLEDLGLRRVITASSVLGMSGHSRILLGTIGDAAYSMPLVSSQDIGMGRVSRLTFEVESNGEIVDILTLDVGGTMYRTVDGFGRALTGPHPYRVGTLWAAARDGRRILTAGRAVEARGNTRTDILQLTAHEADGTSRSLGRLEWPRYAVADSAPRRFAEDLITSLNARRETPAFPNVPSAVRRLGRALSGVEYEPSVRRIVQGADGRIWLQVTCPSVEGVVWAAVEEARPGWETGVAIQDNERFITANHEAVWVVRVDDFDIEHIVRYAVERP